MGTSACERYLTRVTVTAIVITITMNVTHVTSDTELNTEQAVGGRPPRYASAPASRQYLRIYSPGGIYCGMLAI